MVAGWFLLMAIVDAIVSALLMAAGYHSYLSMAGVVHYFLSGAIMAALSVVDWLSYKKAKGMSI